MASNATGNKRIAKNAFFLYGRMIVVLFVSLYTTRIVLNTLGVVDYGIFNVVAGFVSMFAFLNSAMTNTTQRYYSYERDMSSIENKMETYNTALLIQIGIAVILVILLESFGIWYINHKMTIPVERLSAANWVFQFSTLALVFVVLQIPYSAAIIAHEKMDFYAIVSIVDVFLKLIVVLILPHVSYDKLIFYGMTSLLIAISNFTLYFFYSKHNFQEIRFKRVFKIDKFRSMLSFTGWNVLESFAYVIQGQGLNVLINAFFGPVVNAARGVAYTIQNALNGFSENISTAFRPQLVSSFAKGDFDRTRTMMFSMSKFCFVMLCTLSVPIVIELKYILNLWLKGTIPDYTIVFTFIVLANMLLGSLNMPISQTVQATGYVKNYQVLRSLLVTSTLPIAWYFLKLGFSPVSVYIVMIIISAINQPLSMALLHRKFSYSYVSYIKQVLFPCIIFLLTTPIPGLIINSILSESFFRLCIVTIVSVCFAGTMAYFVILNKSEKQMLKSIYRGVIKKRFNRSLK